MSRQPRRHSGLIAALITLMVVMIAASGLVVWLCIDMVNNTPQPSAPSANVVTLPTSPAAPETQTVPVVTETVPPTTAPEPEHVVATATISAQGDLLMHEPVFATCRQSDGSYNYDSIFRYVKDIVSSYDYAIANLETTFGGDDFVYQGNPAFNCPDGLADSVLAAGYDMLLTTNNHCGDTMAAGVTRTLEHVRGKGLATLGTQLNDEEPKYTVVDVNGIKIGMAAFSWAYSYDGSKVSMNGLTPIPANGTINFFMNNNLDSFFAQAEQLMEQMKAAGAEATIMHLHWGQEYQLQENATQRKIAQKLCDLGYDVIIGGHPHVVQPMALLESAADPEHKTVCIYSLGNAVSNQRNGYVSAAPPYYTEDGVIFTVTFEKYSDGRVYVAGTDVIPTWVNMHTTNGVKEYNIVPLQDSAREQWRELFGLDDNTLGFAQRSYDRSIGLVRDGLQTCQTWLAESKDAREAYYLDLATNPEKYAAQSAETASPVVETTGETIAETTAAAA